MVHWQRINHLSPTIENHRIKPSNLISAQEMVPARDFKAAIYIQIGDIMLRGFA